MRKADGILCADFHIMEQQPICRTDNFLHEAQWEKIDFIAALQIEHDCPVFHAGDLFDYWKPSPELIAKAALHLPQQFYSIYGNHDLPQHSLELLYKSGMFALQVSKVITTLADHGHWGKTPNDDAFKDDLLIKGRSVYLWHVYNWKGTLPWPGCTAPTGANLLRKHPQFDLILTGDNHTPFVEKYQGRLLVNPGSIFRIKANQADHKPRVYLWYADTNEVEPVYLPIKENVITREHIEAIEKKQKRNEAFISQLNGGYEISMSFEQNLELFREKNNPRDSVMEIIYKSIGK